MALHEVMRFLNWFCLKGRGYQFWSGIGISFFMPLSIFLGTWRRHNCHVKGCWRIGHIDPKVAHPACKHHHSHAHLIGGTND